MASPRRFLSLFLLIPCAAALAANAPVKRLGTIDPDPELFDGSRTKPKGAIEQQEQPVVDDWEKGNLEVYDTDEQGNNQGGQGTIEGKGPGMEISGGGNGLGGLPIPMMGGGSGKEGEDQGGIPPPGTPQAGIPEGQVAQAAEKPGEVPIGDPSQSIASAAQPLPTGDTSGLEDADENKTADGGDSTRMKAASGQQSGRRGSGIEKGDAIPTDL